MKSMKLFAITVAFMMMMAAGVAIVSTSDESDAATAGTMNVYVFDGSSWTDKPNMAGYNGLQALQNANVNAVVDDDYVIQLVNQWGPYDDINPAYGAITSVNGVAAESGNDWFVYIYQSGWIQAPCTIGFITPFTDGACPSAFLVLYYGSSETVAYNAINSHITGYNANIVPSGSNYQFTFTLKLSASGYTPSIESGTTVSYYDEDDEDWYTKTLTPADLTNGIKVRGYGSNAYAALKNAIGTNNVVGTEIAGPYYGWIDKIFNLGTVDGTYYTYWVTSSSVSSYLPFSFGTYSTLTNVPSDVGYTFVMSDFCLEYMTYVYP